MVNIAILVAGQIRNSDLGNAPYCNNTEFTTDFKTNIMNEEILKNYNLDIFFCVDNINTSKLRDLCGSNLKGVLELDKENISEALDLTTLESQYLTYYHYRQNNTDKFPCNISGPRGINYIQKFYKTYCAYQLMADYENKLNIKYKYILLLRPDNRIYKNFIEMFDYICNNNVELMSCWDWGFLGKYDIMCHYCKLILLYGKYNLGEIKYDLDLVSNIIPSDNLNYYTYIKQWSCWTESPEVQSVEHFATYCMRNKIQSNKLNSSVMRGMIGIVCDRKKDCV